MHVWNDETEVELGLGTDVTFNRNATLLSPHWQHPFHSEAWWWYHHVLAMLFISRDWETGQGQCQGRIHGVKYRVTLEKKHVSFFKRPETGAEVYLTTGQQPMIEWMDPWSSQSLNINLTENLWQDFKTAVYQQSLLRSWANLPRKRGKNISSMKLIDTYYRHFIAVIAVKSVSSAFTQGGGYLGDVFK